MNRLRLALRLNAASCILFAALFLSAPAATAAFLGAAPAGIVQAIGFILMFNGFHLAVASRRQRIAPAEILYFSVGDIIWVNLTLALVASGLLVATPSGVAAALIVAFGVGALGLLQVSAMTRPEAPLTRALHDPFVVEDHLPGHLSIVRSIAASWLAMKTWVKVWLFGVNAVFLAAIAFWPEPIAKLTMAAYVASGPWLFAIMIVQRGITRSLGLAHLVPWLPLLGYLLARLSSELLGPRIQPDTGALYLYACVLTIVLGICLALDAYDVWRWNRGEHFRMGSVSAARAGASMLAIVQESHGGQSNEPPSSRPRTAALDFSYDLQKIVDFSSRL